MSSQILDRSQSCSHPLDLPDRYSASSGTNVQPRRRARERDPGHHIWGRDDSECFPDPVSSSPIAAAKCKRCVMSPRGYYFPFPSLFLLALRCCQVIIMESLPIPFVVSLHVSPAIEIKLSFIHVASEGKNLRLRRSGHILGSLTHHLSL